MKVTDHVRIIKDGLEGRVLRVFDIANQGNLAVIRLDKPDPILGALTTAFEGEVEVIKKSGYEVYVAGPGDPRD
ncbi:MAG: hypothetical protein IMZ54_06725 [Acidobacteria bacterium]|nr:hypothetical protein [Acidobacteriota bacterium]MBE3130397.1 hypothetical protein [Acidobacteriota bacterium]